MEQSSFHRFRDKSASDPFREASKAFEISIPELVSRRKVNRVCMWIECARLAELHDIHKLAYFEELDTYKSLSDEFEKFTATAGLISDEEKTELEEALAAVGFEDGEANKIIDKVINDSELDNEGAGRDEEKENQMLDYCLQLCEVKLTLQRSRNLEIRYMDVKERMDAKMPLLEIESEDENYVETLGEVSLVEKFKRWK